MQNLSPICKCCFWGCLFLGILRARWRMPVYCCLGYLIPSLSMKCNSFFFLVGFANDLKWTEELPLWFLCISSQITTHSCYCCQNHQGFLCRAAAQKIRSQPAWRLNCPRLRGFTEPMSVLGLSLCLLIPFLPSSQFSLFIIPNLESHWNKPEWVKTPAHWSKYIKKKKSFSILVIICCWYFEESQSACSYTITFTDKVTLTVWADADCVGNTHLLQMKPN